MNLNTGQAVGTGFLIQASTLNPAWGSDLAFVTNAHVVSDDIADIDRKALRPELAGAEFTRLPGCPKFKLGKKLFHSPHRSLDAWICLLEDHPPPGTAMFGLTFYRPRLPGPGEEETTIYVCGHPRGGELQVSLINNSIEKYNDPFVYYGNPTEPGSSGSPVFNHDLETFALHHRADDDLKANEGVLFDQIRDAVQP